jgi:hypothetical protein
LIDGRRIHSQGSRRRSGVRERGGCLSRREPLLLVYIDQLMLGRQRDGSLHQGIQLLLQKLEITHIPSGSEHGVTTKRMQSLNILESSKGSVRGCHQLNPVSATQIAYQGYQQRA